MIEDRFRKWVQFEIDNGYDLEFLHSTLSDDDDADSLWEEFSVYHRQDLIELVREQIKAIWKKRCQSKD